MVAAACRPGVGGRRRRADGAADRHLVSAGGHSGVRLRFCRAGDLLGLSPSVLPALRRHAVRGAGGGVDDAALVAAPRHVGRPLPDRSVHRRLGRPVVSRRVVGDAADNRSVHAHAAPRPARAGWHLGDARMAAHVVPRRFPVAAARRQPVAAHGAAADCGVHWRGRGVVCARDDEPRLCRRRPQSLPRRPDRLASAPPRVSPRAVPADGVRERAPPGSVQPRAVQPEACRCRLRAALHPAGGEVGSGPWAVHPRHA